jgi:hypothetical protein
MTAALAADWTVVRQRFEGRRIEDVEAAVGRAFESGGAAARIKPGASIAVTAGSRGIDAIVPVLRAVAGRLRALGAHPFVTAAMGSHGGATGEGQREVLRGYGITEATMGCPVRSSMEVVSLGLTDTGFEVFCDRNAFESDGIVVVGRVKPHSILTGDLGSGLLKMTAIGLGKQRGADSIHVQGVAAHLVSAARRVLARAPIALGIALVENAYDRLAIVEGVGPEGFEEADRRLLAQARAWLPRLPAALLPLDVLIVDRIGKDISGAGMDPNVIGMWRRNGGEPDVAIARIVALDLSDASHGNAIGVGMADLITASLEQKIDRHAMAMNALTSGFLSGAKVPIALPTAQAAIDEACRPFARERLRAMRIQDTAHLEYLRVSPVLGAEATAIDDLEIADAASHSTTGAP